MTTLLHLEDRLTRLSLAPELGGSLVNWIAKDGGHALLRPSDQAALAAGTPRRLACYPLVPWSNRIAEGGFDVPDGWLALAPNTDHDPYPIHGSAWQQPWQVSQRGAAHICLRLDSTEPFAYRAEQRIELADGCLRIHLQVTHLASRSAWHGIGFHPYFPRTAETQVCAPASKVWLCDDGRLPVREETLPSAWDFRQPRRLPAQTIDNAFSDWNGHCQISQVDAGYRLDCHVNGAAYYLLYCPAGQDFFCFEPVTHPVNAHHLPGRPGLRLLSRGQSLALTFSLHYRPLA